MAWNPKKTLQEFKEDPKRAARAVGSIGMSELPTQGGPVGDVFKSVADTGSSVSKKAEETFGGRKTDAEKEAIDRQIAAGDEAYTGTKAELDKLKGADDKYMGESEGNSKAYQGTRNSVIDTFTQNQNAGAAAYKENRNRAMGDQLRNDQAATDKYRAARNPVYEKYQTQLTDLSTKAGDQAKDATKTYDNQIQPRLLSIMNQAQTESGGAMALKDAGDPNNSVNQAWRGMYEKQAQGVGKQALADVGVMNSLGAQATANQLGGMGGAVSTNAMLALQGQNMGQSGQAYARAQQQMQGLRDQGLEVGRQESNSQYNRGQAAKDRYAGSVRDFAGADSDFQDRMSGYRGEQLGYGERGFGAGKDLAEDDFGIDRDRTNLLSDIGRTQASEEYTIGKERNREDFNMGDRKATEDFGISSGLSGMRHGLSGDQAGREISNINQRATTKSGIAANQAGVEQQKRIMGPQILAGAAGTGVKAYAASGGGGGGSGAALTGDAGDYGQEPDEEMMRQQAKQGQFRPKVGRYS